MFIHSIAHYLPQGRLTNAELSELNGLSEDEIFKKAGIESRVKALPGEDSSTMGIAAVRNSLASLSYPIGEVDLVVGATYTPDDTIATLAHRVQKAFGIAGARALTLSSACSSAVNAVEVVEGYFATGKSRRALVVASEHNSAFNDEADRYAGHLWGDGAVALHLSRERLSEDDLEVLDISTLGLGDLGKGPEGVYLRVKEGVVRMPNGKDVFVNATQKMVEETAAILKRNGLDISQLDYMIPHQANTRIITKAVEKLGLPEEKALLAIRQMGNTGCASAPIVLSMELSRFRKGELLVMTVFGGGYSCGSMLIRR